MTPSPELLQVQLCADLAKISYEASPAAWEFILGPDIVVTELTPDQCLWNGGHLIQSGDTVFIVIRGTSNLKQWLFSNMRVLKTRLDWADGKVHGGFAQAAEEFYAEIIRHPPLREAVKNCTKLVVTGHSLGGATAVLLAQMLQRRGLGNRLGLGEYLQVVTFGAPRVGNYMWAESYIASRLNTKTIQVRNIPDPVCRLFFSAAHVPFLGHVADWFGLGYWHPPCTPYVLREQLSQNDSESWEKAREENPVPRALKPLSRLYDATIRHHEMDEYIARLTPGKHSTAGT